MTYLNDRRGKSILPAIMREIRQPTSRELVNNFDQFWFEESLEFTPALLERLSTITTGTVITREEALSGMASFYQWENGRRYKVFDPQHDESLAMRIATRHFKEPSCT